ncbi:MAG: ATP-binding protein [Myxococcota bacterium]|nr:ATP-binding protein [Myxococcota bacterium]
MQSAANCGGASLDALTALREITSIVAKAADGESALVEVARWLVRCLADACVIELIDGDRLRVVAVEHSDARRTAALREVLRSSPADAGREDVRSRVARTGTGELFAEVNDESMAELAGRSGDAALRGSLGVSSLLVVPLRGARASLGVVTVWSAQRAFDQGAWELLGEIASRAAFGVERSVLKHDLETLYARSRLLADTSRALATQLDFDGVARSIADAIGGSVVVGLVEGNEVVVQACASGDPHAARELHSLVQRGFPLDAFIGEQPLGAPEVRLLGPAGVAALPPPFTDVARRCGMGSVLVAPLRVQERVAGLMCVFRDERAPPLGHDELSVLSEIVDRAATAFERARFFEQQQRTTQRLRLLSDAGTLLAQSLEVTPTLETLARLAVVWFAQGCAVELREGGSTSANAVATADPRLEERTRKALARYSGAESPPAVEQVLASARPLLLRDVDQEVLRRFAVDEEQLVALVSLGMRSVIVVPLVARGIVVGVLSLARSRGALYDEDDLALATELGRRAALALDNARLFKRATEAVAARDEFLAIASHELNTPLTPLKMQLDSLRRGKFAPDRVLEKLDAASRQVTRLANLISELLDVSRISGGRLHLQRAYFDMAALLDEIIARMAEEAERAASPIILRAERPCFGSWDRMRMDQVVTNLLTNAVKYGSGKPIEIELTCRPGAVRLVVRDHGIGIAPEHQRRVFERFERAASVRHYGGFGLGLWIARQIVEGSDGTIVVESAPGEGSTFIVTLPNRARAEEQSRPARV